MPDLIPVDHDPFAQMPPPGYTPSEIAASQTKPAFMPVDHDPFGPTGHPTQGPTDNTLGDIGRRVGSAVLNAGVGMISPLLGRDNLVGIDTSGHVSQGPTPSVRQAQDNIFNTTGMPEYAPETWMGRRTQDALTGAAGALMTGNPAMIPAAAGGGATSGGAAELFPNHPLAASLLGFLPGAWAGNQLVTAPQRLAAPLLNGAPTEPYAAFTRQGLPTELAGTTTGEPGLQYAEKLAARMPGSEGAVGSARDRLVTGWRDRLDQIASGLGTATTPQELGTSLQSAAQNWLNNFKTTTGNLWNDYYTKVSPQTPYAVSNYETALKNTLGNFPGAPATGGVLQPATLKSLSDALGVDLRASGGTLPAETVHAMRTAIGEKLANPQTVADTTQAALKQLYAGLTQDIQAGAGTVSPAALTAFHKANAATAAGHDLLETQLNPVLTAATPEQAAQYAMSQARLGGSRLGALTFNLPGAAGDLGSYALRNAATNIESPSALANALTGRKPIYSPEAQNVLFPQPGTQADIADMATVGRAMQPLERDLANSPTATHQARGVGRVITAVELARQGHDLGGVPGGIAGAMLGLGAPEVLGRAAQATALNPWLSALYGRQIPYQPPSPLASALIAPTIVPQLAQTGPRVSLAAPATSASSPIR